MATTLAAASGSAGGHGGISSIDDSRPPNLHISALSPLEYSLFTKWARQILKSPSGVEGLLDEQDALAWLRRECAVGRIDEAKILTLFERYPLGLEQGHFFALLRLVSWAQQGAAPSKALVFSQTTPPVIGLKSGTQYPLPTSLNPTSTHPTLPPPQHPSTVSEHARAEPRRSLSSTLPASVAASVALPSSKVPPPVTSASANATATLPSPLVPVPSTSAIAPPVPPETSKPSRSPIMPSNPFKESSHTRSISASASLDPLLSHDTSAHPSKHGKPKLVKPTPVVATAGQPNPVSTVAESSRAAGASNRSTSPPLPPRPGFEKPPPPLPPRAHISPLIQAGLEASMQVRKQKDSLPPKTFTVLQTSSSKLRPVAEPRLLTGESAPPGVVEEVLPPPLHQANAKRRVSGADSRSLAMKRGPSEEAFEQPQRAVSGSATVLAAPKPSRPSNSRHRQAASGSGGSHAASHVAKPKPVYPDGSESVRNKPTLPSWLREQEELQRSALIEGRPLSPPPLDPIADEDDVRKIALRLSKQGKTVLDEEFDLFSTDLDDQASRAASIDRPHNPFVHRSSQAEAEKIKLELLPERLRDGRSIRSGGSRSPESHRGPARSKTLPGKGVPPPPPSHHTTGRKRMDSQPAQLDSGTYAGFRHPAQGTLRLMPRSGKADVGLKRPVARRESSGHSVSSGTVSVSGTPYGRSHRDIGDDEDSGELSGNSTNPTSVHGLASSLERKLSGRSDRSGNAMNSLKEKVSEFLKIQDAPPKGQRPIDELTRDALRLAERKGWINRRGDGDSLIEREGEGHRMKDDSFDSSERDDDAPTPDDAYGRENLHTPTQGDDSTPTASILVQSPPSNGPQHRSESVTFAPAPYRPSGFVARRASRIEERESHQPSRSVSATPSYGGAGGGANLGRAASFSVRSNNNNNNSNSNSTASASAGTLRSGRTSSTSASAMGKRSSWLESLDEERKQRFGLGLTQGDDEVESQAEVADEREDQRQGWQKFSS